MCVRLYPEIPVAMEVLSEIKKTDDRKKISISISDCIKLQHKINYSPFLNIFTSPVGSLKDWDENDYIKYIKKLKEYFTEKDNPDVVYVNTSKLFKDLSLSNYNDCIDQIKKCINQRLLIEGAYSDRTLAALGLL